MLTPKCNTSARESRVAEGHCALYVALNKRGTNGLRLKQTAAGMVLRTGYTVRSTRHKRDLFQTEDPLRAQDGYPFGFIFHYVFFARSQQTGRFMSYKKKIIEIKTYTNRIYVKRNGQKRLTI
jgi:hypothetical protein